MMANGGDKQNPMAAMMAGMGNMGGPVLELLVFNC